MAQANSNHTTKISEMIRDPFVRAAFARAEEDDGGCPALAETDHPRHLDGGAAERMTETTGHRVLALVQARSTAHRRGTAFVIPEDSCNPRRNLSGHRRPP